MSKHLKLVLTVVAITALVAVPAASARPAHHPPPPISGAAAFALPPSGQCVKGGAIKVELRKIRHVGWTSVAVKVNGQRFATIPPSQVNRPVSLGGLPTGAFTLSITARTDDHRSVTAERHYHSCATKPRISGPTEPKPPTHQVPTTPTPTEPPPNPPAGPTGPQPGRYLTNGYGAFYVSPDGGHVQDVSQSTTLGCSTGGSNASYGMSLTDIPIAADGSFGSTEVESTILSGKPVKVTTTFNGDFDGTKATGTYRQDIAYEDGSGKSCTTNAQSWSASSDTGQGSQVLAPPQPGRYLTNGYGSYYVSADRTRLQDLSQGTTLSCGTGSSIGSAISITDIPIEAQSTFETTQVESTILSGKPVKVTTTFKGHFHGLDGYGNQRAAGTYREDVAYEDGSGVQCTTGVKSWSASVDSGQGSQVQASPQPGRYLTNGYGAFYVSPDGGHVQDVAQGTTLSCSTGATISSSIAIEDFPIEAQNTFTTTQIESAIYSNKQVKITTVLKGHFHGLDRYGDQRAAGTYREEIAYEDGSGVKCTTGTQAWSAELDSGQGSQTLGPPEVGIYHTNGYASFSVSADHAHVQNVAQGTTLYCSTGGNIGSSFAIADIPIVGQSTFRGTLVETGLLSGKPVKFTIAFNGHLHGFDGYGNQRAAGTYREDVVFEDGSGKECTTDTVSWTAGWSSS